MNTLTPDAFYIINTGYVYHPCKDDSSSLEERSAQDIMEEYGNATFGEKNLVVDVQQLSYSYLPAYECGVHMTCHSPASQDCWQPVFVIFLVLIEGLTVQYARSGPVFRGMLDAARLHSNRDVEEALVSIIPEKNVYEEELRAGDIVAILPSTLHRFYRRPGYAQTAMVKMYTELVCGFKGKCPPPNININQYPSIADEDSDVPLMFPVGRYSQNMEFLALQACFHFPLLVEGLQCDLDMDGMTSIRRTELDEKKLLALIDFEVEFDAFDDCEKHRKKLLEYTRLGNDPTLRIQSVWTLIDWIVRVRTAPERFFYEIQRIGKMERPLMDRALRLLGQIFHRPLPEIRSQDTLTMVTNVYLFLYIV